MLERLLWLCASVGGVVLLVVASRPFLEASISAPPAPTDRAVVDGEVRVAILNGAGEPRLAARMTRRARALGLDVIREGNAGSFNHLQSVVIDRSGDLAQARAVAALLGIPHTVQQIDDDTYRLEDVEIIIGQDYRRLGLLDHDEGR